ncbi:tRNA/rRNA cytosine-C5-methylase [Methylophilaceae bacterium 11]|jgi:16S rRNA (cytosine967-C5)-methyltransferase|uniref:RsmB/NOP family class I SAM-dependent RNA methyltransferase n=1 Tax=Methylotenera sp. N17 TaxID=1502761 RepID=UPI00044C892B|nr:RsmB/NOP family class I SAM-dependent RNA methyltransferase [Methylotenera sp. N17]EUJ09495.1 tRNA/rRNA cytosine-C5-methylase [Methylophilaceae bacterium 11]
MTPNLLRQAAMLLTNLLDFNSPADAKLGEFFRNHRELGTKERAFVAESVYGVLRRLRYLSVVAANEENDPDDARKLILAWLLRVQGKSLRELDDILTEQQKEWAIAIKAKSTDNLPLAVQADVRDWFWDKLVAQYGETEALTICRSMFEQASLDLRVNTIKATREEVLAKMQAENTVKDNVIATTPYSPIGIRMGAKLNISRHVLFTEGKIEVQDEGSQLLSYLVSPKRGMMVADFCAGAGGKTLAIGALMKNTGRLYAFDVSEKRLHNLGQRLKRSGLSNLHAQVISSEQDPKLKRLNGKFDRVLVDAPCSGLGTLRRNPDLKWRQTEQDVLELTQKQSAILARAAKLTKAGGRLIYATCSLLRDENEAIVEAFIEANPEFSLIPANEVLAHHHIALDTGQYLKLLPHLHQTDGFFAAVFEKRAANPETKADTQADKASD